MQPTIDTIAIQDIIPADNGVLERFVSDELFKIDYSVREFRQACELAGLTTPRFNRRMLAVAEAIELARDELKG